MRPVARILACLVAVGLAGEAHAEALGKLFFTPERRAALERQRQLNLPETRTLEGNEVRLDGVVTRSSGRSTIWINQQPQNENASGTGVAAKASPSAPGRAVITPSEESSTTLKVGESINRATREKADAIGDGKITVKPQPTK
jgi:hypothetical protein